MINQAGIREGATIFDQFNYQTAEKRIKSGRDPTFHCCRCVMFQG